jgi:hypothetical protein
MSKADRATQTKEDVVPLFGTWRRAYFAVVAVFVCDVAVFYAISRYFA